MITIIIIAFLIFHYSVSTERGRLEDEAGCNAIVWFTQVASEESMWLVPQLTAFHQSESEKSLAEHSC